MNRRLGTALAVTSLLLVAGTTQAAVAAPSARGKAARPTARIVALGHPVAGRTTVFRSTSTRAVSFRLSFGDHSRTMHGRHRPARRMSHTFAKAGWHTVTLTVTGAHGKRAVSKDRVLVVSPPTASASPPATGGKTQVSPQTSGATVTGYSPTSGSLGAAVTITGTGFTSPATASFGGTSSPATVVNSTTITTTVPHGAGSGTLTVTTHGGTVTVGAFTVSVGIRATVTTGPPTTSTTVYGAGYAPNEGLTFYLGSTQITTGLTTGNGSFTQTVTVPAGVQPGATQLVVAGARSGLFTSSPFTVRTDWAQQGFGTDDDSVNPYEDTVGAGNVNGLGRAWSVNVNAGSSGVTVVNNIAYTGGNDGVVHAVSAITGTGVWSYSTGNAIYSTPSVVNNVVYVGSEDDTIYALNAATGALIWRYATGYDIRDSSPTVANGLVYVGSNDDKVYALNATTGALVWSHTTGNTVTDSTVAVSNGLAFVGSEDDKIYALNATTGTLVWSYATGGGVDSSPSVYDGIVYIGSTDEKLYAVNALSGSLVWTATTGGSIYTTPAVTHNLVYVGSGDGSINAFNALTGAAVWTYTTNSYVFARGLAVANGVVYVGSYDDRFYGLDADNGAPVWTFATGSAIDTPPSIVNGDLYGTSTDGDLYSFTLAAGTDPSR